MADATAGNENPDAYSVPLIEWCWRDEPALEACYSMGSDL